MAGPVPRESSDAPTVNTINHAYLNQLICYANDYSGTPGNNGTSVGPGRSTHNNKHERGFKIAHLNIRSLIAHIEEFRIYIKTRNFDIISINETMLDYTISDHEISVPGYDFVRNDRHRNGGGVVLYIRNSINFKIRHDLMMDSLELL